MVIIGFKKTTYRTRTLKDGPHQVVAFLNKLSLDNKLPSSLLTCLKSTEETHFDF